MKDNLLVYYNNDFIGVLRSIKGIRYVFSYTEKWLSKENAVPISISLPLAPGEFDEERSMSFFSNLLPESKIREKLAKSLRISEKDSYALLEVIGGECAGAISILPGGTSFSEHGDYQEIPNDQLSDLLSSMSDQPLLAGNEGIRLSLAGAQDKLPVYYTGKNFFLPRGNKASTHIIKTPISDDYPHSVINEAFCMKLAKELGLPVPEVTVIRNEHESFYLIERYDRYPDSDGNIKRLHQEDFCQALAIPPEQKYQENGGPSLVDCFNLISEHSSNPAVDKLSLLKWVMFNVLIGNADSHAKNLSFLYNESEITLSPFYDLLCTKVYPNLNDAFSMKIGKKKDVRYLSVHDWKRLAESTDTKFSIFPEVGEELLNGLEEKINKVKIFICKSGDEEVFIESIRKIIDERSKNISNIKKE